MFCKGFKKIPFITTCLLSSVAAAAEISGVLKMKQNKIQLVSVLFSKTYAFIIHNKLKMLLKMRETDIHKYKWMTQRQDRKLKWSRLSL